MRQFYVEHDLVSAEIQAFFQDGSMSLHTRSLMYGKLSNGVLVCVTPTLMKRLKQHFHAFDFGVHAIFGMNGFVWVSARKPGSTTAEDEEAASVDAASSAVEGTSNGVADPNAPLSREERERVCRARNALVALDQQGIAISPATVSQVYHASLVAGHLPKAMLLPDVQQAICAAAHPDAPVDATHGARGATADEDE